MTENNIEHERNRNKVVVTFDSIEVAVTFVQDFWNAMPHAPADLDNLPKNDLDGWRSEITAGDRTIISRDLRPANLGKFLVSVSGNHQPLTPEADAWLRGRGY
jgi:hypothetical protein